MSKSSNAGRALTGQANTMGESIPHHIALVGPLPPPFGGMANQTLQLARLLKEEGIHVSLIRTNAPYRPEWVSGLRGIRALFRLLPYLVTTWRSLHGVQLVHLMANSGWSWHLYVAPVIWLAYLQKVPVIVNYRGGEAGTFFAKAIRWVRPSMLRVERVIVPSGFLQKIFADFQIESKIVPNIIDLERFVSVDNRRLNTTAPHFIVCRNLEYIYDVATAVGAFSSIAEKYPQAHLTIAGEGPERSRLEEQVTSLGIAAKVTFAGRLEPEQMAKLFQSADVMLNTSRVDNMPNALLEAMSAGVPIISTDAGGIPYMVKDGSTALLRPVGDERGIAEAALYLLQQESLYRQLSDAGIKEVTRYRWNSVKPLWMQVYAEALAAGPGVRIPQG